MRVSGIVAGLAMVMVSVGQSSDQAVMVNGVEAKWTHDKGDPPGSEGVMLRMDPQTHGMELFVRFPAGYTFPPHSHDSNERILVLEGRLAVGKGAAVRNLDAGGYAFLPAKQVQHLSCVSTSRCAFYLAWDGHPASHKAAAGE